MKRGVVELQFNWLFVLILGGAFLLLAGLFVTKQKIAAEQQLAYELLRELRVAAASANTAGSSSTLQLGRAVRAECGAMTVSGTRQATSLLIFSLGKTEGEAITWSQEFDMPYRAENFLYLADSGLRMVIVYDDKNDLTRELARQIRDALPEKLRPSDEDFTAEPRYLSTRITAKPNVNAGIRIVLIGYPASTLALSEWIQEKREEEVSALEIQPETRRLLFYEKTGISLERTGESHYAEKAALYGSLFSSAADYNCLMGKAFKRLSMVSKVYAGRTAGLQGQEGLCKEHPSYQKSKELIDSITQGANQLKRFSGIEAGEITRIAGVASSAQMLAAENEKLQRQSCPEVY